jgi:hypothetical protein
VCHFETSENDSANFDQELNDSFSRKLNTLLTVEARGLIEAKDALKLVVEKENTSPVAIKKLSRLRKVTEGLEKARVKKPIEREVRLAHFCPQFENQSMAKCKRRATAEFSIAVAVAPIPAHFVRASADGSDLTFPKPWHKEVKPSRCAPRSSSPFAQSPHLRSSIS